MKIRNKFFQKRYKQAKRVCRKCPCASTCMNLVALELEDRFPHGPIRLGDVLHHIRQLKDIWNEED